MGIQLHRFSHCLSLSPTVSLCGDTGQEDFGQFDWGPGPSSKDDAGYGNLNDHPDDLQSRLEPVFPTDPLEENYERELLYDRASALGSGLGASTGPRPVDSQGRFNMEVGCPQSVTFLSLLPCYLEES